MKSLFSSKSTDKDKIAGANIAIITIFAIAVLVFLSIYEHSISKFFDGIFSGSLLTFLLVGLIVMALLQKLFPKWKYIQSNSDIVNKG